MWSSKTTDFYTELFLLVEGEIQGLAKEILTDLVISSGWKGLPIEIGRDWLLYSWKLVSFETIEFCFSDGPCSEKQVQVHFVPSLLWTYKETGVSFRYKVLV